MSLVVRLHARTCLVTSSAVWCHVRRGGAPGARESVTHLPTAPPDPRRFRWRFSPWARVPAWRPAADVSDGEENRLRRCADSAWPPPAHRTTGNGRSPFSSHHPHGARYVVLLINSRVEMTRLGCVLCGTTKRLATRMGGSVMQPLTDLRTLADVERFSSGWLAGGVKGDLVDPGFRLAQQILAAAF